MASKPSSTMQIRNSTISKLRCFQKRQEHWDTFTLSGETTLKGTANKNVACNLISFL